MLPALAATGLFLVWVARDGGYSATVWYPGALFLLALLAVVVATGPHLLRSLPRLAALAVGLFAVFVLWTFASVGWAEVKGIAWEGANRTLLYFTVFTLFAVLPLRPRHAAVSLAAFSLGAATIAFGSLLAAGRSDDPSGFFIDARFSVPTGYPNANAAVFLAAFPPALFFASRRETPLLVRGLFLGAAVVLVEVAVLAQSRGSIVAAPAVLALYLVVVPGRVRSLLFLAPVVAAALVFRDPLLELYSAVGSATLPASLAAARDAVLLSFIAVAVSGIALALLDRRLDVPRRAVQVTGAVLALATIAAALVAVNATGNPTTRAADAWDDFKSGHPDEFAGSRFTSGGVGSNRYDFWRVAVSELQEAPLTGTGAGNFAVPYLAERESSEEPLYPHSVELMIASQTGAVGALLFAGFLLTALAAACRASRRFERFERGCVAAAVVVFAYWFAHGSADWFWEIPALGAPAFAALGIAAGARGSVPLAPPRKRAGRVVRTAAVLVGIVSTLLAGVSYALPWLAAKEVERAGDTWRANSADAFAALDRARRLDFLSDEPDLFAGAIASRLGERRRMREAFTRAAERNPSNWYAHLELAIVDALAGRRRQALVRLARAKTLNPREEVIDLLRQKIGRGEDVSPAEIDTIFLERYRKLTT